MTNLSKQDVQSIVDNAKNQVLQRTVTRQDWQTQNDLIRVMLTTVQQNQQIIRQSEYQRVQMLRRTVSLEARIAQLDQEIRTLRSSLEGAIGRLADQQPEKIIMPVAVTDNRQTGTRGLYSPT